MTEPSARLLDLLERRKALAAQGRPATAAELCADCPELVPDLERLTNFVRQVESLSVGPAEATLSAAEQATLPPPDAPAAPSGALAEERYAIEEKLGAGGMGTVYRARDRLLGRTVALKVIRSDALSPALRARFEAEARAVARLDHPHIVKVFDVGQIRVPGEPDPVPFLTLEFVEGGSLRDRLEREPLTPAEAARLVAVLARAMQHAHERGIVHRDLKPDNVLLAPPSSLAALNISLGCPKIGDFGLARQITTGQRLTGSRTILGTPRYMAPEQAEGHPDIGPPADTWALGVILYQLLTGALPFIAPSVVDLLHLICRAEPVSPNELRPGIPAELSAIVHDCLRKRPEDRPTAGQLAERLEQFLRESAPAATASFRRTGVSPVPVGHVSNVPSATGTLETCPTGRGRRRTRVLVALVGVALLAGLGWAFWPPSTVEVTPSGDRGPLDTKPTPMTTVLRIRPLQVLHYETAGAESLARGRIGEQSFATRHGDAVTLTVELSVPAYFYVIGFNFDGKEQLLWPVDDKGEPSDQVCPPRLERLRFPAGEDRLYLNDPAKSGVQVYVVAASSKPLPPHAEWRKVRTGVNWQALPPGKSVWEADAKGTYEVVKGLGADRGSIRAAPGVPPLSGLCRYLLGGGVEAAEAIAFPVLPREGQ